MLQKIDSNPYFFAKTFPNFYKTAKSANKTKINKALKK